MNKRGFIVREEKKKDNTNEKKGVSFEALSSLDAPVSFWKGIPFGLQHVMAMFVANLAPIFLVASAANMSAEQSATIIQAGLLVAGLGTCLQLYGVWLIGSRLPMVTGISFTYVAAAMSIAQNQGYGAVAGAVVLGGLLEVALGLTAKYWRRFVPPIVSAIVVTSIGFSLLSVGATSFGGGSGAEDFGSWQNLTLGLISLVACLAFQLLMNAAGVANAYIIGLGNGGGHAWNMAQMDDGYYYYFDVTWTDSPSSAKYFAAGEMSFSKNHTPNTADGERWDYLYDLPDVPEDDGTDETGTVLTEGDFTYQLYTDHAVLTAYTGEDVSVSVPEEADGLPVTAIKGAFAGNTAVQLVDLPKTVTAVSYGTGGIGAFENCTALQAVSMILTSRVEYHSFRNCSALQTATLPQTVTLVGAGAFAACTSLNTLRVYSSDCTFGAASVVPAETVLYGYAGSTAQAYAKKYDRTFLSFGTVTTAATTAATETTTTTTQTTTTTRATTQTTSDSTTATTTATTVTAGEILLPEVGDCNNDGVCRVDDLVLLNQYLLGSVQGSEVQRPAMDCNADGTVDSRDSQLLAMFLMQLIPRLPA